jgi:hypothetical protein
MRSRSVIHVCAFILTGGGLLDEEDKQIEHPVL